VTEGDLVALGDRILVRGRILGVGGYRPNWHPLLRALPDVVVVNASVARWLSPTLAALGRYLDGDEPGAELVTRRLAEILFVQTIASWLRSEEVPEGWLRALTDPHLGRAIGTIHARPAEPWSIEALSRIAGMSRSAFFQRFRTIVGASPAKYVAGWR
jgi:Cupin